MFKLAPELIEVGMADPPSPANVAVPFPATVVITPVGLTLRIRWFKLSAIYILPSLPTATPLGRFNVEPMPLLVKPGEPFPTTVVMVISTTLRIRWFKLSAIYILPSLLTATPYGELKAEVVGVVLPPKPGVPIPATTVFTPVIASSRLM